MTCPNCGEHKFKKINTIEQITIFNAGNIIYTAECLKSESNYICLNCNKEYKADDL